MELVINYDFNGVEKTLKFEAAKITENYHNNYLNLNITTFEKVDDLILFELTKSTPIKVIYGEQIFENYQYFAEIIKRYYSSEEKNSQIIINLRKYF